MSDGTAFRAAGVRLKKMRGFGLRSEPDIRTTGHFFLFGPEKLLLEEIVGIGKEGADIIWSMGFPEKNAPVT